MDAELKKNNRKIIIIIATIVTVVTIAVVIGVIVYSNSPARRLQQQLDLGARYLSELDYEQAIAAYEAALEIDPKSADAYIGLISAYAGNGEVEKISGTWEAAKAQLGHDDTLRVEEDIIGKMRELIEAYTEMREYRAASRMLEALNTSGFTGNANEEIIKMSERIEEDYLNALIDGTLPLYPGEWVPEDSDAERLMDRMRYRAFLITSEMSGESFESFALTDLDRDGREADLRIKEIIGDANEISITFYENTNVNRDKVLKDAE